MLHYDRKAQTVTVAGSRGKFIKAGIEDIRHAVPSEVDIVCEVQRAIGECTIDRIDYSIEEIIDDDTRDEEAVLKIRPQHDDDDDVANAAMNPVRNSVFDDTPPPTTDVPP